MEYLAKSRSSSQLKKPIKAHHGHSSSLQFSHVLYIGPENSSITLLICKLSLIRYFSPLPLGNTKASYGTRKY